MRIAKAKRFFEVASCLFMGIIIYFMVRFLLLIPTPIPTIPKHPPNENNRKYTSNNTFSVVIPDGWNVRLLNDSIQFDSINHDSPIVQTFAKIVIIKDGDLDREKTDVAKQILGDNRLITTNELQVFETEYVKRITFQGIPALEIIHEVQPNLDGKYSYKYILCFIRNQQLFSITYFTTKRESQKPPARILDYFDTFRIE